MPSNVGGLDCFWVAPLDFNVSGNYVFLSNPPRQTFGGGVNRQPRKVYLALIYRNVLRVFALNRQQYLSAQI